MAPSVTKHLAAKIESELRWFSLAVTLIGRSDREDALLTRARQVDERYDSVLKCHAEYLARIEDEDPPVEKDAQAVVRGNVDQCGEMVMSIIQAAADIERSRKGDIREKCRPAGVGIMAPLPPVNVPEFGGEYADWPRFRDIFNSVVHSRTDLSPAYKMAQLMGRLSGEPHDILTHLEITDASYETAWGLLIDRYDNRRLIVDGLIDKIFGIPKVSNVYEIRSKILNPVTVAVNTLDRLKLSLGDNRYIVVNRVLRKLPSEVVARFEQAHGGESTDHLPSFENLRVFLEAECRRADCQGATTSHPPQSTRRTSGSKPEPRRGGQKYNALQSEVCPFCREGGHGLTACADFKAQRVQRRRGVVKQRYLCFRCLGTHFVRECSKTTTCRTCGGAHHELLCLAEAYGASSGGQTPPPRPASGGRSPPRGGGGASKNQRSPPPRGGGSTRHSECRPTPPSPPREEDRRRDTGGCPEVMHGEPGYATYSTTLGGTLPPASSRFSPPLAERPRVEARPPQFGRMPVGYFRPTRMPPTGRGVYYPGWDPYTGQGLPPPLSEGEGSGSC